MKTVAAAVVLSLALPAAADGLVKYRDWADSPQGYFLSKAERTKWATITTDADAEKFIADYQAARGKGFATAIQSRIDAADKTYKTGKVKGARSPAGKTLVLLGAPTTTERKSKVTKDKIDPSGSDAVNQGGGAGSGGGKVDPTTNVGGPGVNTMRSMQPEEPALVRWLYSGASVPLGVNAKEVAIEFLTDAGGNVFFKDKAEADAVFEKVIEYWAPKTK
ncbi:MAG: hypothetical protein ACHQPI_07335 [Thermoanaerobaculia bacterium]